MSTTAPALEAQTFTISEEIFVRASLDEAFASLVANLGRLNETPDGKPLPMVLETHPGGRWYRDRLSRQADRCLERAMAARSRRSDRPPLRAGIPAGRNR